MSFFTAAAIATNYSSANAANNSNIAPQQKLALKQTADNSKILSETRNRLRTKLAEFTADQPAKIDWTAPRNDANTLSLQLLSKYNTAEKLSNINFSSHSLKLFYSFSGAFHSAGEKYSIENQNSTNNPSFQDISKLADTLLLEQAYNLNSLLTINVSYQIKMDKEFRSQLALGNRFYTELYLGEDVIKKEDALAYKQALLTAIITRAKANFIQKAGGFKTDDKNYESVEMHAQRSYQQLLIEGIKLKLQLIIAKKDVYTLSDFVNSMQSEIETYHLPISSTLPTHAFVSQFTSNLYLPSTATNEYYFRITTAQRDMLKEEFVTKHYKNLLIILQNQILQWREQGIKLEEDKLYLLAALVDVLILGAEGGPGSKLDDIRTRGSSGTKNTPCLSYNNNLAYNGTSNKTVLGNVFNPSKINLNLALNPSVLIASNKLNNLGISFEDKSYEIAGCPQSVIDEFKNYRSNYDGSIRVQIDQTILKMSGNKNLFTKVQSGRFKANYTMKDTPIKKGNYYEIDLRHRGSSAEIEVYNQSGIHEGTMSLDGKLWKKNAVNGRKININ